MRHTLGVKPNSFRGPWKRRRSLGIESLAAFRPHVVPRSTDWNSPLAHTGYRQLDGAESYSRTTDLVSGSRRSTTRGE